MPVIGLCRGWSRGCVYFKLTRVFASLCPCVNVCVILHLVTLWCRFVWLVVCIVGLILQKTKGFRQYVRVAPNPVFLQLHTSRAVAVTTILQ
jgi:hypothetical protein